MDNYEPVAIKSGVRMNGVLLKESDHLVQKTTGNPNVDRLCCSLSASIGERIPLHGISRIELLNCGSRGDSALTRSPMRMSRVTSAATKERLMGSAWVRCRSGIRPSCLIRELRKRPNRKAVVSVDILSNGVDVPALEFIVFLRPVKSRILAKRLLRIDKDMNADARNAKGHAGFVMVNAPKTGHACSVRITEAVRKYAAEQGIAAEVALKKGMEEKSREFTEKGSELYAKA